MALTIRSSLVPLGHTLVRINLFIEDTFASIYLTFALAEQTGTFLNSYNHS